LEGLAIEDVGLFNDHLVYFMDIWYIFPRFGMLYKEKSGNPSWDSKKERKKERKKEEEKETEEQKDR
jgi:hypothetical protein